jgi:acetoin utilization deacetylase AcuC-like enzyme
MSVRPRSRPGRWDRWRPGGIEDGLLIVVYSSRYQIDIGPHVFPTRKYSLVHARLIEAGVIRSTDCVEPEPASWSDLALVHTADYLEKMRDGMMSPEETAQLELPWSPEMVEGFRLMAGGTVTAALLACFGTQSSQNTQSKISMAGLAGSAFQVVCHIGGGLHHAFPNHGEGFCPFNDVAVAARVLQGRGLERIAIVDLDVHHGNGTAFTFEADSRVFTFSMHQQHNYPMWKPRGSLDIGLADGAHDATFLRELERGLTIVMAHAPQCVFYLAGADPYEDDQLGGLRLTRDGLRQRDRLVVEAVRKAGISLVITLAGGYARRVDDTVAIHCATIEEAALASQP